MFLKQISDPALAQYSYLIGRQRTGEAIVADKFENAPKSILE